MRPCSSYEIVCFWGEYDHLDDPNIEDEFPEGERVTVEKVGRSNAVTTVPRPEVDPKVPPSEVDMGYLEFSSTYGLCMTRNTVRCWKIA